MNRFTRIASLFAVIAALGLLPASAHALDNNNTPGSGGCNYTDADGYNIPIDDGQTVFVDGKLVTCKGGTITITTAPASNQGGAAQTPPKKLTALQRIKALKLQKSTLEGMRKAGVPKSSPVYQAVAAASNGSVTASQCRKMLGAVDQLSVRKQANLGASVKKAAAALGCRA